MSSTKSLDSIPIRAVYVLTFLVALAAFVVGNQYGLFRQASAKLGTGAGLDAMAGATLALLAFVLAFVVSIATSRFDYRRQLVVDEATAIRAAYLQAGYLPEPYSIETRSRLREYVDLRLAAVAGTSIEEVVARSEEILAELWKMAEEMVNENPGRDEISLFLDSLTEVINMQARRAAAVLTSRLPPTLVTGLYVMATLSMLLIGFQSGHTGQRDMSGVLVMITIFTVVLLLIVDLDRPQEGFLRVSQQTLIDLHRQIGASKS